MAIELGTTQELTNTQAAPVAAVMAYYESQKVLDPFQAVSSSAQKGEFSLANKLTQILLSRLTGCEYISEVNTNLGCERKLAQVNRIERFAEQSTLATALNELSQMNLRKLARAVREISDCCSRMRQHDWRGMLMLDFDLFGLPCGKEAEGSQKGYFSGKKRDWATIGPCQRRFLPGNALV